MTKIRMHKLVEAKLVESRNLYELPEWFAEKLNSEEVPCVIEDPDHLGAITRSTVLTLNGYASVKKDHPLYGKQYDELTVDIEVHGGLTFSGIISSFEVEGVDKDLWWFGFDAAHLEDYSPAFGGMPSNPHGHGEYRDLEFMKSEVNNLIKQLKELK